MKFNSIVQLCKRSRMIAVYEDSANCMQWIGNGSAIFPLYNFPRLTRENIFRIMDIPEEKRDKIVYRELPLPADRFSFRDADPMDNLLDIGKIGVYKGGVLYYPVKTQNGISYIDSKNLNPFSDEENGYLLYERATTFGEIYIAVKVGFSLWGIILPRKEILTREFAAELSDVASSTVLAAATAAKSDPRQFTFEEEEEE